MDDANPRPRIDYYYSRDGLVGTVILAIFMTPLAGIGVLATGDSPYFKYFAALFAAYVLYRYIYRPLFLVLGNKEPALSLLDDSFIVGNGRSARLIPYRNLYSAGVELMSNDSKRLALRYYENGRLLNASISSEHLGIGFNAIVEEIARRVPAENRPRLGPGMLMCVPPDMKASLPGRLAK